jgi:peroxiredoxin
MSDLQKQRKRNRRGDRKVIALFVSGAGLLILGIVALIMLPSPGAAQEIPSAIPVEVNFPAPELNLLSLDGNPVSLEDFRGQAVLVNNWATWCPPCKAEMPDLNRYYRKHQDDNFTLIGIEAGDTAFNIEQIVEQYRLDYPIWLDPQEKSLAAFQTSYLPSSFVIDSDGTVRLAWTGAISLKNLEKYVTPLLEE